MFYTERGKINGFPITLKSTDKCDVVYLGEVVPGYMNSCIPDLLNNEFVFLFTTRFKKNNDSSMEGSVRINLIRYDQLSNFNYVLRRYGDLHILEKDKPLIINDFLEIFIEDTEKGSQIIAHLKKHQVHGVDNQTVVRDFHVLLLRENTHYDNFPTLELGPEFQAEIDLYKAEQRYDALSRTSSKLDGLARRNNENPEVKSAIEITKAALNKEIEEARLKREQEVERSLEFSNQLMYIHKSIR